MRGETLVRLGFATALLLKPGPLLRAAPHRHEDRHVELVARILGLRHLAEALILGRGRGRRWTAIGVAIDGTHALTAFAFAVANRRYRRLALTNGVTAGCFALAGAHEFTPEFTHPS